MNTALRFTNIQKVIEAIKAEENFFNMAQFSIHDYEGREEYGLECNTASCIAGWAVAIENKEKGKLFNDIPYPRDFISAGAKYLGLTDKQAKRLFLLTDATAEQNDPMFDMNLEHITRAQAINTLENLIKTGEVVWEVEEETP